MSSLSSQPASLSAKVKISDFCCMFLSTNFIAKTFCLTALLIKDGSDLSFYYTFFNNKIFFFKA